MIQALTLDLEQDGWETSRGFIKRAVPEPLLDESGNPKDALAVIVKAQYAGLCGSDRGIWNRTAFSEMFKSSLARDHKSLRILGHEFVGEVTAVGSLVAATTADIRVGSMVSGDSHVTCGRCYQCRLGEEEVCRDQAIMGISCDGIFAEYVKLPAKNLWAVDFDRVRPEICAMYDPFGNAVHALSRVDVRGSRVAIFGVGQIGMFAVLLARHFGAAKVIAVDVSPENLATARALGAHETVLIDTATAKAHPYDGDRAATDRIMEITHGKGADVSLEMAGANSSVNNCLEATRPGGQVILFGIKDGDFIIPNFSRMIVKGLTVHNIIGRQIFKTWQIAQRVLSDKSNGVQEAIWKIILREGQGTVIKFSSYQPELVEQKMKQYPKLIFDLRQ